MGQNEEAARVREQEVRAHVHALTQALMTANQENVRLTARIKVIAESAAFRIGECVDLIDTLHNRIEAMADGWEADIRNHFTGSDEEKAKLLSIVAPFRPIRIGEEQLAPDAPAPAGAPTGNQSSS
jgi:hypothetical protein